MHFMHAGEAGIIIDEGNFVLTFYHYEYHYDYLEYYYYCYY